ncbi:MAG: radical SAM protein [Isosphaeraceae bacterium]
MKVESLTKAYVLTHGVRFTPDALRFAAQVNAKRQNAVYNLPAPDSLVPASSPGGLLPLIQGGRLDRPQELFLTGDDGYTVCVSAVAPVEGRASAIVDYKGERLTLATPARPEIGERLDRVRFVPQPRYYGLQTAVGRPVPRWVSACGYNEMNVWPWHDCAITRPCTFCGINTVQKQVGRGVDRLHALEFRREEDADKMWSSVREAVVSEITEAVALAITDDCYRDEVHLIIISGNLADHQLDAQARIYADIAGAITSRHPGRFAEGVVAVTAPPQDLGLLRVMCESGIEVGVFNLEAFTPAAFSRHCTGKDRIGRQHYLDTLTAGVGVFGWGRSWCNFVLGLEPVIDLLAGCEELASRGITPGANVLHRDHGASVKHDPPDLDTVVNFYRELAAICLRHSHRPYYCQLALRTSLANEAYAGRLA